MRIAHNFTDLTGHKYGRWTVKRQERTDERRKTNWLCECECGTIKTIVASNLKRGISTSCGCYKKELQTTHGLHGSSTYKIWQGIKDRCINKNSNDYADYGGRGITVCDRWRESFDNFYFDMGSRPDGLEIDRIDNSKGYSADNCQWVTHQVNSYNRRSNKYIEYKGMSQTVTEWARQLGIAIHTFRRRTNMGWGIDKILHAYSRE